MAASPQTAAPRLALAAAVLVLAPALVRATSGILQAAVPSLPLVTTSLSSDSSFSAVSLGLYGISASPAGVLLASGLETYDFSAQSGAFGLTLVGSSNGTLVFPSGYSLGTSASGSRAALGSASGYVFVYDSVSTSSATLTGNMSFSSSPNTTGLSSTHGSYISLSGDGSTMLSADQYLNTYMVSIAGTTPSAWTIQNGRVALAVPAVDNSSTILWPLATAFSTTGAISIVAGASSSSSMPKCAYIFTRGTGSGSDVLYTTSAAARLAAPAGGSGNVSFGWSVAMSGDGQTVAVAEPQRNGASGGAVHIFKTNSSGIYVLNQTIADPSGTNRFFGYAVSMSTDARTLAVSAAMSSTASAVLIYTFSSSTLSWSLQQTVAQPSGTVNCGAQLSVSGDASTLAFVCANGSAASAAYIVPLDCASYTTSSVACPGCPAGTSSSTGSYPCSSCAAGSYAASTGNTACQVCAPGMYQSSTGQASCTGTTCSANTYGPTGATTSGGATCSACPTGSTSASGSSTCVCSANFATSGSAALLMCTCPINYVLAGSGASATCSACPTGTTSSGTNAATCTNCPAGTSSSGGSACTFCAAGTYTAGNGGACLACTAGYACAGNANQVICGVGFYSTTSATSCTSCSAGYTTASAGTVGTSNAACTACPSGSYTSGTSGGPCVTCQAGDYCGGSANEIMCAPGSYSSSGAIQCLFCSAGYTTASAGATSSSSCTPCAAGTYTAGNGGTCQSCTAGYSCAGGANQVACGTGTYSGSGATTCTPCSTIPNAATTGAGGATCPCATSYYSNNLASAALVCSACSSCAGGSFASTACSGSTNTGCSPCGTGTYSNPGGACTACSTIPNAATTGAGAATCPCAPGFVANGLTGSSLLCGSCQTSCGAGMYQTAACTATSQLQCAACGPNSYSYGNTTSACAQCPTGTTLISASAGCSPSVALNGGPADTSFFLSGTSYEGDSAFFSIVRPSGISYTTNEFASSNGAMVLASGSYFTLVAGDAPLTLPAGNSAMSAATWLKCSSSLPAGGQSAVLEWGAAGAAGATSKLSLLVTPVAGTPTPSSAVFFPVCDGKWHHIALTAQSVLCTGGASGCALLTPYIDGTAKATSAPLLSLPAVASSSLRVGWNGLLTSNGGDLFAGAVDQLRIYNRTLTATEVVALSQPALNQFSNTIASPAVPTVGTTTYTWTCNPSQYYGSTLSLTQSSVDLSWTFSPAGGVITCIIDDQELCSAKAIATSTTDFQVVLNASTANIWGADAVVANSNVCSKLARSSGSLRCTMSSSITGPVDGQMLYFVALAANMPMGAQQFSSTSLGANVTTVGAATC